MTHICIRCKKAKMVYIPKLKRYLCPNGCWSIKGDYNIEKIKAAIRGAK